MLSELGKKRVSDFVDKLLLWFVCAVTLLSIPAMLSSFVSTLTAVITLIFALITMADWLQRRWRGKTLSTKQQELFIGRVISFFMLAVASGLVAYPNNRDDWWEWFWLLISIVGCTFLFAYTYWIEASPDRLAAWTPGKKRR